MTTWGLSAETFSEQLALTLLHFLWQGTAVALVLAILAGLLRLRGPSGRYALNLAALLVMAACPLLTFCWMRHASAPPTIVAAPSLSVPVHDFAKEPAASVTGAGAPIAIASLPAEDVPDPWRLRFQAAQPWVIWGWLAGVVLLSCRLVLGWLWLQWLKRRLEPAPEFLRLRTERLCRAMGLRLPRLCVCRQVREAIATGLIRPLILVPAAWLAELSPDMLEAVLAHELAHLRRLDLWVNLFQRLMETLLFYHPAVWWSSRRLRMERELCCDELAVTVTQDRVRYAQTLEWVGWRLALQTHSAVALSMGGNRMTLLLRVKHVLNPGSTPRSTIPFVAGVMAVLASGAVWWFAFAAPAHEGNAKDAAHQRVVGTLVDMDGRPVAGVEIQVKKYGKSVENALRSDAKGQFKVPRAWRDPDDEGHTLVVWDKDSLGWFHFYPRSIVTYNDPSFRIVLLPLDKTVSGELTDSHGTRRAGVRVAVAAFFHEINRSVNAEELGNLATSLSTTTDGTGRFSVKVPAGTTGSVRPRHPDWASVPIQWQKGQENVGRVELFPGGRIEDRVVDAHTGKSIAGASIGAHGYNQLASRGSGWGTAVSDATGHYEIGGLWPDQYDTLLMQVSDNEKLTAAAREAVKVQSGKPARVDFQVSVGRLLSGRVIEAETGKPLAGCHVTCQGPSGGLMGRTDSLGMFRFYVPPGVSLVYVSDGQPRGLGDPRRTIEVMADRDPEPLVLTAGRPVPSNIGFGAVKLTPEHLKEQREDPAFRLRVVLRPTDGRPVTKVDLDLIANGHIGMGCSGNTFEHRFSPDDEGLEGYFVVEAKGFTPTRSPKFVIARDMPLLTIDLQPALLVPVRGRVLDLQGQPVSGARVRTGRMRFESYWGEEFPWGVETSTDDTGHFELKHVRVGDRFFVRVDKEGTGGAQTERRRVSKADPIDLPDLKIGPPNRTVRGQVLDEAAVPVSGATVVYRGETVVRTTTDDEGQFELRELPTGKLLLTASAAGFQPGDLGIPPGGTTTRVTLKPLPPAALGAYQLHVHLRPRDGKTVSNYQIFFVKQDEQRWEWSSRPKGNDYEVNVYSELRGKAEIPYVVAVAADGYEQPPPVAVKLKKYPEPVVFDLEPAEAVKVRGRVVGEDGKPIAGVKVGLSRELFGKAVDEPWRSSGAKVPPVTDADGRFQIAGIHPGSRVAVYVNKPGFAGAWSVRRDVKKSEDLQLPDLVLKPARRELTGKVVDQEGMPVHDARVYVYDIGFTETRTDANGRFRLRGVPAAVMFLRANAPDFRTGHVPLKADTKDVTVRLSRD